jgi:hypothetical protein
MKTSLWLVIVVVALFLGFLIGYSLAPPPPSASVPTGAAR